jgi:hypothetical protein
VLSDLNFEGKKRINYIKVIETGNKPHSRQLGRWKVHGMFEEE